MRNNENFGNGKVPCLPFKHHAKILKFKRVRKKCKMVGSDLFRTATNFQNMHKQFPSTKIIVESRLG